MGGYNLSTIGEDLFEQLCSRETLRKTFKAAKKIRGASGIDVRS